MNGKDIFKIWAKEEAKWTQWVRPVAFVTIDENFKCLEFYNYIMPTINYVTNLNKNTAIIVDLPGCNSVQEGLALAHMGYRPIPIYNGTTEQTNAMATTNNHDIQSALILGALELKKIQIKNDAPPVFMLDTNRMNRYKMNASIFDNSWDVYYQDMPSSQYLLNNNINKIIVISNSIQKDLKKILYNYQKENIEIFFTNGYEIPKKIKIKVNKKDV